MKEIQINGCCSVADDVSEDTFLDAFIDFVESHGWYFGGTVQDYKAYERASKEMRNRYRTLTDEDLEREE